MVTQKSTTAQLTKALGFRASFEKGGDAVGRIFSCKEAGERIDAYLYDIIRNIKVLLGLG